MKKNAVIAEICSLPKQLEQLENKSLIQLLKELDVSRQNSTISIEDIKNYLKDNNDLIKGWLLYSMNKRIGEGWYFKKENKTKFIVGYLSEDASSKKELKYSDAIQACAKFIYNELFESHFHC